MKKVFVVFFLFLMGGDRSAAQISISDDGSPPVGSAGLEVKFTGKGVLIPRITYDQRNAIANPEEGLIIYCTNCSSDNVGMVCLFTNGSWNNLDLCMTSSPVAGSCPANGCGITWNWHPVAGAAGYKWNAVISYDSAIDMGPDTLKNETGLAYNTTYTRYVWAYSSCGPSVPITLSKTIPVPPCGQAMTDCRDGKVYNTVMIGGKCWMAQNMNVGVQISKTINQANNGVIEKYCFADISSRCLVYGGLYQWDECMDYTASSNDNPSGRPGICPAGWHVPSEAEWLQLNNFLGGSDVSGGKLKETGYAHWSSPNTGATNSSGFTGLPGGQIYNGSSSYLTLYGNFWTTTEASTSLAWVRSLGYDSDDIFLVGISKAYGFSVRCVRD